MRECSSFLAWPLPAITSSSAVCPILKMAVSLLTVRLALHGKRFAYSAANPCGHVAFPLRLMPGSSARGKAILNQVIPQKKILYLVDCQPVCPRVSVTPRAQTDSPLGLLAEGRPKEQAGDAQLLTDTLEVLLAIVNWWTHRGQGIRALGERFDLLRPLRLPRDRLGHAPCLMSLRLIRLSIERDSGGPILQGRTFQSKRL